MPARNGYHNGYVPAFEVITTIEHHLGLEHENWEEDDPRLAPLTSMWEMADLRKQLGIRQNGGKLRWIPFGLADSVLCKLRLQNLWRHELLEAYERVNLSGSCGTQWVRPVPKGYARCQLVGCSEIFPSPNARGVRQKYCSKKCKQHASQARRRGFRSQLSRRFDTCPAGHDRSPENTYIVNHKSGQVEYRCRVCENERKAARRAEREAA